MQLSYAPNNNKSNYKTLLTKETNNKQAIKNQAIDELT